MTRFWPKVAQTFAVSFFFFLREEEDFCFVGVSIIVAAYPAKLARHVLMTRP